MIDTLNNLIKTMRHELEQYGEMLARLDEQQEFAMRRATDELLQSVGAVQEQGERVQEARRQRGAAQAQLAREYNLAPDAAFLDLIPLLPEDYRPLMQALVQENNELLVRVQQRARQNHLLLLRSLELMQNLINSLFPGATTPVYNGAGALMQRVGPARSLYEAVG